jgi:hypothetical protein
VPSRHRGANCIAHQLFSKSQLPKVMGLTPLWNGSRGRTLGVKQLASATTAGRGAHRVSAARKRKLPFVRSGREVLSEA